ncbi:MAG TPA: DNA polymerase III subunit gamma/tau [Candidatus Paceibacterota bacterium]|jgi:DNA polymerase-3 subunit gamma/tau|nr:DNA polymerase III subunit gamma/tau [Candidatus Paceibacterota bacterium]
MHDQVLYRKYRPSNWEEVVGQEHIVSVLSQSIDNGNFSHAYLFTGSRGTGKTSVARIFAKALGTNPEDILEIDAASNRGIDDIRALREAVRVLPFSSRFKVYIIDEVHMLSRDAFNALLKTLEEPPAHCIFILATTELDKVPETILSRCQVFSFRKPTERTLVKEVERIAKEEKIVIDGDSASLVAFLGDGSFRDTLSILQKVFSSAKGRTVTRELTESVTGAPSLTVIHELYSALIEKDMDALYKTLARAEQHHTDMMLLAQLLLDTMRLSLMYRYSPSAREQIEADHSEQYTEVIKRGAVENPDAISSRGIVALITAIERIAYASIPTLPLELAFIEMTGMESASKEA